MTNRRFWQPPDDNRWAHGLLLAAQSLIVFIFFCGSWWWRPRWVFADTTPAFIRDAMLQGLGTNAYTAVSFSRYALTPLIIALVFIWILMGFRGVRQLVLSARWYWLMAFGALVFWIFLSVGWSQENSYAAQNQASQWVMVLFFVLVVSCVGPSARIVGAALLAGAIFQGVLGIAQTVIQHDVGIHWVDDHLFKIGFGLYEFGLNPNTSGANVIQSGNVRFLRAHGLTPHPNLLGPALVMGLLGGVWLWEQTRSRAVTSVVYVVVLWSLFLTFSRASIGGLMVGLLVLSGAVWWKRLSPQNGLALLTVLALVAGLFYTLYQPLVDVRAGSGAEGETSLEQMSVESRQVLLDQAETIIQTHPYSGVGIGNFPYVSQQMLQQRPELDIKGDNVHRVYYLVVAEIGMIGTVMFVITGLIIVGFLWRRRFRLSLASWGLAMAIVGWLAIGWFEFFWWVLMPYQVLFWGTMATLMRDALPDVDEAIHWPTSS